MKRRRIIHELMTEDEQDPFDKYCRLRDGVNRRIVIIRKELTLITRNGHSRRSGEEERDGVVRAWDKASGAQSTVT